MGTISGGRRIKMLEDQASSPSTRRQCFLLGVNRSSHYKVSIAPAKSDVLLMNEIQEVWLRYPFYGYRRITKQLQAMGHRVNKKKVQRLMQVTKLKALYPKPNTSLKNKENKVYPYLLKDIKVAHPNQCWQVDITYLRHKGGFMYLSALIDVYSRYVVSWDISNILHTNSCLDALTKGVNVSVPEIINSDQGCQFTSADWIDALESRGIKVSMTGKGRCHDNIYIERFWRTVKYEEFYLNDYDNVIELKESIGGYIEFYNHKRFHQSLDYKTPAEKYYNSAIEEPVHMMDNANALPTSTQAQQQLLNKKRVGHSLN